MRIVILTVCYYYIVQITVAGGLGAKCTCNVPCTQVSKYLSTCVPDRYVSSYSATEYLGNIVQSVLGSMYNHLGSQVQLHLAALADW